MGIPGVLKGMDDSIDVTIETVVDETHKEHARLMALWNADKLMYEPAADSLYVWHLEARTFGHRNVWSSLFTTRALAVKGACVFLFHSGGSYIQERYAAKMKDELYDEVLSDHQQHFTDYRFEIEAVEVRAEADLKVPTSSPSR